MEGTHGAYLHTGSKCGYLTCWVMGIVNIIGRAHKDVGWSQVICPGAVNAEKCMDAAVVAPLGFSASTSPDHVVVKCLSPAHTGAILHRTTAAVQLCLYHARRMQWINIEYLSAASLHLLHQLSLPSPSEETRVSQLLFPCAIYLRTYSYSIEWAKYSFLCVLRSLLAWSGFVDCPCLVCM